MEECHIGTARHSQSGRTNSNRQECERTHLADGIKAALVLKPVEERGQPAELLTHHVLRGIQRFQIRVHKAH